MSNEQSTIAQEIAQVMFVGAIGLGIIFGSVSRLIKLWPRFIGQIEVDLTDQIIASFQDGQSKERGH